MEGNVEPEVSKKVSRRDVGIGFIFLGAAIMMLTVLFFFLSLSDQEYYGLFSYRTHLVFDAAISILFLAIGFILKNSKSAAENAE